MSMFREAPNPDGTKGPVSFRRVVAAFFAVSGIALAIYGVMSGISWQGIAVLLGVPTTAVLVLTFFTTWGDVASVAKIIKR